MMLLYEHIEIMNELTDEEFGRMARALYRYEIEHIEPAFSDRAMRMMWETLKSFDDRNYQNTQEKSRIRSEAGKRGMAKRWGAEKDNKAITSDNKNSNVISEITGDSKNNSPVPVPVPVPESSSSKDDSSCGTTTTETLFRDFRKSIGRLSATGEAELAGYADRIGEDLVREIIRKCADAGGHSWAYVRKALAEAETQGVSSAEEYRLTHPLGAGRNQRVDRQTPSGNDFLKTTSIDQSLKRLKKKEASDAKIQGDS